jgi:hypothetical protein
MGSEVAATPFRRHITNRDKWKGRVLETSHGSVVFLQHAENTTEGVKDEGTSRMPVVYVHVGFNLFSVFYRGLNRSRDSVVGIATSYGLDDRGVGVQVPVGVRILTSPNRPDRL